MSNQLKIDLIFREVFLLPLDEPLDDKDMLNVDGWNSVEHFAFISELEKEFNIVFEREDVIAMTSYSAAVDILRKYGV